MLGTGTGQDWGLHDAVSHTIVSKFVWNDKGGESAEMLYLEPCSGACMSTYLAFPEVSSSLSSSSSSCSAFAVFGCLF